MPQLIKPYPTRDDLGEAFAAKFDALLDKSGPNHPTLPGPCWLWTRGADGKGYGAIGFKGRVLLAHRIGYVLKHGSIPQKLLLHGCDTPLCCNPDHAHLGDHCANMKEAADRGLIRRAFGVSNQNARLTEQQVIAMRERHAAGDSILSIAKAENVSWPTARKAVEGLSYPAEANP